MLGKLEKCFRDASALINLEQTFFGDVDKDKDIMRELASMCEVFQGEFLIPEIITPESDVVYNPNFGIAGNYVGGADGDILIDGVLYDFKTSKSCGYTWQDVTQLIGYYFLNEISVEKGDFYEDLGIRRVAFYRARFGEIEYYDTDIFTEKASLPPQAFSIVNGEVIFNGDNISFIDKTTRDQTIEELLAYFNKPI
ncbi:hypothetical protein SDC9_149853 [bioreactor metagenome]|uniref:PD-(D/E)XK endonuclease-like domain-containing protein n=1 Tax=bioreactor metagenome TaxID=1076179 RepID=A0A645ELJ2_9ZZZZ